MTPPFHYADYDIVVLGVDETNGRFGEVSLEICKQCGAHWLRYAVEYEAFSASGRWYRGLVSPDTIAGLTPDQAPGVLAGLPWYFYGGSYFQTPGRKGKGALNIDLSAPHAPGRATDATAAPLPTTQPSASRAVDRGDEVICDEFGVCHYRSADGTASCIGWFELQTVALVTSDSDPFGEDVHWVLSSPRRRLSIPQSARGSEVLLSWLQALPGFDHEAVIAAMAATQAGQFLCWSRAG